MKIPYETEASFDVTGEIFKVKIGDFPRPGIPKKDRNGADTYTLPEGIAVHSVNPITGEACWSPVTHLTVEENCHTVEVTIGNRKCIVSDNESLAVFDPETGALTKVAPSMDEKRMIPVLTKDPTPFGTFGNRDFGWWVGSFLSDGWSSGNTYIGYAKEEDIKREEFVRITRKEVLDNFYAHEYVGRPEEGKLGSSVKIHLNSKELASKVDAMGFYTTSQRIGKSALYKIVPSEFLRTGSEEFLWGILSGLIDGDGCIVKNESTGSPRFGIRINTSSKALMESIKDLLYRLGINYSVTVNPPRGWSNEAYVINPSTIDMFNNLDKLTCVGSKETALIDDWKNYPPVNTKDLIPLSNDEVATLKGFVTSVDDRSLHVILSRTKGIGVRVNRGSLLKHMDIIEKHIPTLASRIKATNTHWYTITNIEDAGTRQVFDLAVEGTKVFAINNGLIIWDTMTYYVPVSDKAVKEAYNKMLPSKNLLSARDYKAHYLPQEEYILGGWLAYREGKGPIKQVFKTKQDAILAYKQGKIGLNDNIQILS